MDQDGKLSLSEIEAIAQELGKRQIATGRSQIACDLCGHNKWTIGDHLIEGLIHRPTAGLTLGGPVHLYAQSVCGSCGNTKLINATSIGFRPDGGVRSPDLAWVVSGSATAGAAQLTPLPWAASPAIGDP